MYVKLQRNIFNVNYMKFVFVECTWYIGAWWWCVAIVVRMREWY